MTKVSGRDLGNKRFQLRTSISSHGPLHKAEVASADHGQFAREPLLTLDPLNGRQPIIVLIACILELTSGACGATATLDKHLVSAFGIGASGKGTKKAAASIGRTEQDG